MKKRTWRGLLCLSGSFLALCLAAGPVVNAYRTNIDAMLGTTSTKIESKDADPAELYTFKSDYANTKELVQAVADIGERAQEEGTVLLKNNNALPLSSAETQKVSLLGFNSYDPLRGGDMGSSLTANSGTDADTVDMVQAFEARGFKLNETLKSLYTSDAAKAMFKTDVTSWGHTTSYYHITSPATDGVFTSKEPSPTTLDVLDPTWRSSVQTNNTVIVTIARGAGENRSYMPGTAGVDSSQNLNQTDPLGLSDDERNLIKEAKKLAGDTGKVIVLLNNASAMEIDELKESADVDAMLQIGLPGGYGLYGVADILKGEVNPSGRLSDTYAVCNSSAPSAQNYGDLSWTNRDDSLYINDALVEAESIYDGYYYYETRYADVVLGQGNADNKVGASNGATEWKYDDEVTYPFGYGLSYTTFKQTLKDVKVNLSEKTITAEVEVENTGSVKGKDAVQLYVSLPWAKGQVEKSAIQLVDFGKTGIIEPGKTETVTITADAQYLASWDSSAANALGTTGCYTLDAGDYCFSVGNAHEALQNVLAYKGEETGGTGSNVKVWNLATKDSTTFAESKNGTKVENQLGDMDLNSYDGFGNTVTYLSRGDWSGTFPKTYKDLTANAEMVRLMSNDITTIGKDDEEAPVFDQKNNLTLSDLKGVTDMDDPRWSKLMDQIGLFDCMVRLGFGGTSTKAVESIMSPEAMQNDGPNGIYSYALGKNASKGDSQDPYKVEDDDKNASFKFGTMPNETVLAQTFNKDIAKDYGHVAGNYSLWANLPIWWGCGTNLHRTPYNARNHEYYSEDPVLTAEFGSTFIQAGLEYGLLIAPKHLAFNDTEINRTGVAVFMTEQKARQLELRGTQACIEDGALALMTAFNRVGCLASNSHYGLMQNILRKEWGFKGLISEDFIQNANYSSIKEAAVCGITMTCNTGESTAKALAAQWSYATVENVQQDNSLSAAFKQAMTWQFYAIAQSNAMDGLSSTSKIVSVKTPYDIALLVAQIVLGLTTAGALVMYVLATKKEGK